MFDFIVDYIDKNHKKTIESDLSKVNDVIETIIHNICTQKTTTKPFEIHMIREITNQRVGEIVKVQRLRERVEKLEKLEIPDQRTTEWYAIRRKILTASSLSTAFGEDFFKSRNELILDKIEPIDAPLPFNPITEWGVKYEDVAIQFYEHINGVKINDFGLIEHPHFEITGASPDGICSNDSPDEFIGRMLEIKCPPKRKFTQKSAIPKGYWYQMQSQLECTDLEECDFLQVKFKEYLNEIEFEADNMEIDGKIIDGYSRNEYPKGVVITYKKNESEGFSYLYPELMKSNGYYRDWIQEKKLWIESQNYIFTTYKFWTIEHYACETVKRDRVWWTTVALDKIYKFYSDVEYYRDHVDELKSKIVDKTKDRNDISDIDECLL